MEEPVQVPSSSRLSSMKRTPRKLKTCTPRKFGKAMPTRLTSLSTIRQNNPFSRGSEISHASSWSHAPRAVTTMEPAFATSTRSSRRDPFSPTTKGRSVTTIGSFEKKSSLTESEERSVVLSKGKTPFKKAPSMTAKNQKVRLQSHMNLSWRCKRAWKAASRP